MKPDTLDPRSYPASEYHFGEVSLFLRTRQLLRDGRAVHVEPKVFDLIAFLVLHRDRVVLHEMLLRHVWAGDTVCTAAVTQCVAQARRALGDSARAPRFIRTFHRQGYRFVGHLRQASEGSSLATAGNVLSLPSRPPAAGLEAAPPDGRLPRTAIA
jgi:DNA-binding winged helix-turn-helix (wHTH) protein